MVRGPEENDVTRDRPETKSSTAPRRRTHTFIHDSPRPPAAALISASSPRHAPRPHTFRLPASPRARPHPAPACPCTDAASTCAGGIDRACAEQWRQSPGPLLVVRPRHAPATSPTLRISRHVGVEVEDVVIDQLRIAEGLCALEDLFSLAAEEHIRRDEDG